MRRRRESTVKRDLYEYDLDRYDLQGSLVVLNRSNILEWNAYRGAVELPERQDSNLGDIEETEDPLSAHLFTSYHRRMEKEEKRLMEFDRQQVVNGAEKVFDQQRALMGPYWQREISQIVKIDNSHDTHEMRAKRKLALEEIALFVSRFNKMEQERKKRQRRYTEPTRKRPKPKKKVIKTPPPDPKVWIYVPPRAFGVCIPSLPPRPRPFELPRKWTIGRAPPPSPREDERESDG